jgi:hypothetical protein
MEKLEMQEKVINLGREIVSSLKHSDLDRGEITAVEAMKKLRLKKTSFYKLKNADKNAEMK